MPGGLHPSVRHDGAWARQAKQERLVANEQAHASELLRQHLLSKQHAAQRQRLQLRREQESMRESRLAKEAQLIARDDAYAHHVRDSQMRFIARSNEINSRPSKRAATRKALAMNCGATQSEHRRADVPVLALNEIDELGMRAAASLYTYPSSRGMPSSRSSLVRSPALSSARSTTSLEARVAMEQREAQRALDVERRKDEAVITAARAKERAERAQAAKDELNGRRYQRVEMAQTTQRQAERERQRSRLARDVAEQGRLDNIHYLNTHGDRLGWTPHSFHKKEDGDGRWPYPIDWSWVMRGMNILQEQWWLVEQKKRVQTRRQQLATQSDARPRQTGEDVLQRL